MPPPEVPVHTRSGSVVRTISFVLVGLLLGVGVALVGGYYVLASPLGEPLIRDYFVPRPAQSQLPAGSASAVSPNATSTTVVLVPKAYASEAYYIAINSVVNDVTQLSLTNQALAPALDTLNSQTLSCNFNGFYANMTAAQQLIEKNQILATQFDADLSALSAANASTADTATKQYTAAAIDDGKVFDSQMQSYIGNLSELLQGNVPTNAQVSALSAQIQATHDASAQFSLAMQTLITHFSTVH